MTSPLYEQDFYAWANRQADLLRAGNFAAADMAQIAEEIESMGRSEKRELVNRLAVLMLLLLKWRYQASHRGRSRQLSIEEQRYRLSDHLADNPSLRAKLDQLIADAYRLAVIEAERETGLPRRTFPETCPWPYDQMMDARFWPEM